MSHKKFLSVAILSWFSLIIILATAILELNSPPGVFLSWGYIVGILLTMISDSKRDMVVSVALSLLFVSISFFRIENDAELRTILMTSIYAGAGLTFTGYFVFRFIKQEAKARNERTLMAGIFSWGTQGIVLTNTSGKIVLVNPYVEKMFGYAHNKLIGKNINELIPTVGSSFIETDSNRSIPLSTKRVREDLTGFREDGSKFPLEITSNQYESGGANYAVTFVSDISLRKEYEENLEIQKKELETVNQQLEAFSYSVSHDLRSPLRIIGGFAAMLEEDYGTTLDENGKRLLTNIQRNAQRMGMLIDDLLSFSRLGRKEVRRGNVNMTQLTKRLLEDVDSAHASKAQITVDNLHNVMADEALIGHVMINLLTNAIKYSNTKTEPRINVSSTIEGNMVVFCVRDNGVGFDMRYVSKLFGVFQRLHADSEFEGNGVGLAIARRIVEKHGGAIWATGVMDVGASFYFSLPVINENKFDEVNDRFLQPVSSISGVTQSWAYEGK